MMLQSIFNCCASNKVEDDKTAIDLRQGKGTVFIFVSTNVLCRSLLGTVIQALERKGLIAEKMEFKSADPSKFQKSALFKNPTKKTETFSPIGVFMIWKGENAFTRVSEVIHRVGNEHTIPKVDILFTQSPHDTKKEVELWFEKEVEDKRNGDVAAAPVAAEEGQQQEEVPAEPGEPEQGNHLSVPPTDTRPNEPTPGYEDAVTEEAHEIHHPQPPAQPPPEAAGEQKEQQQ